MSKTLAEKHFLGFNTEADRRRRFPIPYTVMKANSTNTSEYVY
jgi:hypothetical protein